MTPEFLKAWAYLQNLEGGAANMRGDPGGDTQYGVTKRDYPELFASGRRPTLEEAWVIAYSDFWLPLRCEDIQEQRIAQELFECAFNTGGKRAVTFLQKAYNLVTPKHWLTLKEDGALGPKTLAAVNRYCRERYPNALYRGQNWYQGEHYIKTGMPFLEGWFNRRLD